MKIQDFLLIALVIGLVCLPAVLLALLLRVAPIHSLVQRNRSWRLAIVVGNGCLCFGVIYLALVWLASYLW